MEEENTQNPLVARSETETIPVYDVNLSIEDRLRGYLFAPTDTELLIDFLNKKLRNEPLPHDGIKEVKVYDHSPQLLAGRYPPSRQNAFYFFSPRDRKYGRGTRPNRLTKGNGYWKASGGEISIMNNGETIGSKTRLVFYQGKPPTGEKTNWFMYEYKGKQTDDMKFDDYVLCRIHKREVKPSKDQNETADNRELAIVDNSSQILPTQSRPVIGNVEGMTNTKELLINRIEDHCVPTDSSLEPDAARKNANEDTRNNQNKEGDLGFSSFPKVSKDLADYFAFLKSNKIINDVLKDLADVCDDCSD